MKLLTYFIDPGEASDAKERLLAQGIAVQVGSVDPHIVRPSKSGSERIGLWVVSDEQFDEAVKLLKESSGKT